jgi:hypothetical protein
MGAGLGVQEGVKVTTGNLVSDREGDNFLKK